jgi:hypothetical protein
METWSNFSTSDLFMAFMGFVAIASTLIVLRTAFTNTDKLERDRKNG